MQVRGTLPTAYDGVRKTVSKAPVMRPARPKPASRPGKSGKGK